MSFDKNQFKDLIERVLKDFELYSEESVNLLLGTAAQESQFGRFLRQLDDGPALGVFQMEPNTEKDIWENFIKYNKNIRSLINEEFHINNPNPK